MRRISVLVLLAFVLGATTLAPAALAQSRGMGRLNGVTVSESGDPLDGVAVKTPTSGGDVLQATSTEKGAWALGGIGKGDWSVEFAKAGYETRRVRIVVEKETLKPEVIKVVLKRAS
ncbi:MAG: carboxypeptidase regulatory-like domain-containing protein [Vicinamibacterales bacterium]|nr:carboxypeptidase regulatory-like domain-containing protein [Vicinamibacterales bacterium]